MDEAQTELGGVLREAREYLGLSQHEVAQHLDVPRSAISMIESGRRKVDSLELKRLAELYQRPVAHFTGDTPRIGKHRPEDVEILARTAAELTEKDRLEVVRFAEFLRARAQRSDE